MSQDPAAQSSQVARPTAASPTTGADAAGQVAPWRLWRVGDRVMVRLTLPEGDTHRFTDVIGTIVAIDEAGLILRKRDGTRQAIAGERIAIGKCVPPPPTPRRTPRA